ncbi:VTT domain-containing protein [Candidatus Manganitrophus noduliformans]|uniref:PLD phosphodiesterase domain-containing protein n=1 Tax=Candidatus Manganitrophus noduliformans TaxID=2606439 RepID=A0A7X6DM76_9BACT|nr:VTT domain-containing protein [Candidatus Manganitrophus noduliformans]NKE69793.1 hypothetical protein [Candidatus Manganitrophus noduliformans]
MNAEKIIRPGRNCYRIAQADRVDLLVDAAAYYRALYHAILQAQERLVFLGWQFDSRVSLLRGEEADRARDPVQFLPLLQKITEERPQLQVYLLAWDHSIVFAPEREWFQSYRFQQGTGDQIHFVFDHFHPAGGSHHQKIVLVDGIASFCGGLDICGDRWDTPQHRRQNPLRKNEDGTPYSLFHDVQIAVQGEAVSALEEIFLDRWAAATGERLAPVRPDRTRRLDLPHTLRLSGGPVSISRTVPAGTCGRETPVQEIAHFYDDAIASAERLILIENQYFTSRRVFEALHKRISDTSRPGIEVIVILPQAAQNWKEELAIGFEQRRMLQRLETAAKANHCPLGIYTPIKTGKPPLPPTPIYVHSKVLVIDDRILSIGSANTSNRSLGLDTECNLNIEADGNQRRREIAMVCYTLLGEHLEQPAEAMESLIQRKRGWVAALDAVSGQSGRLHKLNGEFPETWIDQVLPEGICFDPESPLNPEDLFEKLFFPPISSVQAEEALEEKERGERQKADAHLEHPKKRTFLKGIPLFLLPLIGVLLYFFLERKGIDLRSWMTTLEEARASHWTIPLFMVGTVIASVISFPITFFLILGGVLFGAYWGTLLNWTAALAGATVSYFLGLYLGRPLFRFGQKRAPAAADWIKQKGFWAILVLRVIGVFPFTVVNFIAGASKIRLSKYLLATALGMLPGTFLISYFSDAILQGTVDFKTKSSQLLWGLSFVLLLWLGSAIMKKWWLRRQEALS